MAVRRAEDPNHRLAVLIDSDAHYARKDWRESPDETVERLTAGLVALPRLTPGVRIFRHASRQTVRRSEPFAIHPCKVAISLNFRTGKGEDADGSQAGSDAQLGGFGEVDPGGGQGGLLAREECAAFTRRRA